MASWSTEGLRQDVGWAAASRRGQHSHARWGWRAAGELSKADARFNESVIDEAPITPQLNHEASQLAPDHAIHTAT
jgi:hypothetical protein